MTVLSCWAGMKQTFDHLTSEEYWSYCFSLSRKDVKVQKEKQTLKAMLWSCDCSKTWREMKPEGTSSSELS